MEANRAARYGIHATVRLDPKVRVWVEDQARKHIGWCGRFGIAVEFEDAVGDVVDAEIEGFAARDWTKFGLACRMLGVHDFTANFRERSPSDTEGGRIEVVFRPSLWEWLVDQSGGGDLSDGANGILANARHVDWGIYKEVEEMVGEDCFLLAGGPPENAIELCRRLLHIGQM